MNNILYIGNQVAHRGQTPTTIDTLAPKLEALGYQVRRSSLKRNKILRLIDMWIAVARNRNWANVVLIDTYSTSNFWYAVTVAYVARYFKIKYVPILHGGNLPNRITTNPTTIKIFFKNAYQVVCPSVFLNSAFAKANYNDFMVIPNSINLDNYQFKKRDTVAPKLLWVRSLSSIYNPEMALHVLEKLQEKYPNAQLTMVGPDKDGSLERCKNITKSKNLNVTFTGLLSKEDWWATSKNCDLFINTTRIDNFPVTLLEAMALGLPIVSTNVGGIPFLIAHEQTGLLVDKDAVSAMVTAIDRLVEDPIFTGSICDNAYSFVRKFDWNCISKDWKQLLS